MSKKSYNLRLMTFSEVPTPAPRHQQWFPLPSVFRNLPGFAKTRGRWRRINDMLHQHFLGSYKRRLSKINRIIRIVNSFLSALAISLPHLIRGGPPTSTLWRETFLGIRDFLLWSFEVYVFCGEEFLVTRIKFLYKYTRFLGLESEDILPDSPVNMIGNRRHTINGVTISLQCLLFFRGYCLELVPPSLRQYRKSSLGFAKISFSNRSALFFSSGSRGLIPSSLKTRNKALIDHFSDLTKEDLDIPLNSLIDVKELGLNFATAFMRQYTERKPVHPKDIHVPISNSASYDNPISLGGIKGTLIREMKENLGTVGGIKLPMDMLDIVDKAGSALGIEPIGMLAMLLKIRQTNLGRDRGASIGEYANLSSLSNWRSILSKRKAFDQTVLKNLEVGTSSVQAVKIGADMLEKHVSKTTGRAYTLVKQGFCHARVICVEEQGYKSRVLSCMPAEVVYCGHVWRTLLKRIFSDSDHISVFNKMAWLPISKWAANPVRYRALRDNKVMIYSVDQKSATDKIPRTLLEGMVSGLVLWVKNHQPELWKDDKRLSHSAQYLLPSVQLEYPPPLNTTIQRQGTLMGHPLSWLLLNLDNYLKVSLTAYFSQFVVIGGTSSLEEVELDFRERILPSLLPVHMPLFYARLEKFELPYEVYTFELCGDDLLIIFGLRQIVCYRAFHHLLGGEFSKSVDFTSFRYGVFTEHFFKFEEDGRFTWLDYIPVRSFCKPVSRLPGEKDLPPWVTQGNAVSNALRFNRKSFYIPEYILWSNHVYRSSIKLLWECGLEPYLPTAYGGLGFPPENPNNVRVRGPVKRAIRLLLAPDLKLTHLLSFNKLSQLVKERDFFSKLGTKIRSKIEEVIREIELLESSIKSDTLEDHLYVTTHSVWACRRTMRNSKSYGVPEKIDHLDFVSLNKLNDLVVSFGFVKFNDFIGDLRNYLESLYFDEIEAATNLTSMSMRSVSREFSKIVRELNRNPHDPSHQPLSLSFLEQGLQWKYGSVWLNQKRILGLLLEELSPSEKVMDELEDLQRIGSGVILNENLDLWNNPEQEPSCISTRSGRLIRRDI